MKLFSLHSFNRPVRILFVCLGNICRSPMAEFVMKDLVRKAGLSDRFEIASAATSREELGNPVYPPARRELQRHGIACEGHAARQMTRAEYAHYMRTTTCSSAWTTATCVICGASAAATRRASCCACST